MILRRCAGSIWRVLTGGGVRPRPVSGGVFAAFGEKDGFSGAGVWLFLVAWRGVAWRGVAWRGVAWRGVAWRGVAEAGDVAGLGRGNSAAFLGVRSVRDGDIGPGARAGKRVVIAYVSLKY